MLRAGQNYSATHRSFPDGPPSVSATGTHQGPCFFHTELAHGLGRQVTGAARALEARWDPRANEVVVHQHAGDAHHRRPAVVALYVELVRLDGRVSVPHPHVACHIAGFLARWNLPGPGALVVPPGDNLHGADEEQNLREAECWDLVEAIDAIVQISKLDSLRRREVAWPAEACLRNVARSGHHGYAAMFNLDGRPARKLLG